MGRWIALTGTPGTGKSRVAGLLPRSWAIQEVGELALDRGAGRRSGRGIEVDLDRLRRVWPAPPARVSLLVGHLSHLLPVDQVIVLRCHPLALSRRLARRGSARDRAENAAAEAVDRVLYEVLEEGLPVRTIDTTGRDPASIARQIERIVGRPFPRRATGARWLADPRVTAHLLRRSR